MTTTTIEVDERGRAALRRVAEPGQYKATKQADGSILLEPAKTYTAAEIALLSTPSALAAIKAFEAGAATMEDHDLIPTSAA